MESAARRIDTAVNLDDFSGEDTVGIGGGARLDGMADARDTEQAFGIVNSTSTWDRSSSVVMTVLSVIRAPMSTRLRPTVPAKGRGSSGRPVDGWSA
ncbi:MAG: hypothetical protein R3D43_01540 [Tepidamorphaceae bacterium]